MARTTNRKPRATIGTGAALQATLKASLTALDSRTLPHGVVFNGLDLIDQAIGDVSATSAILDEIIANMSDGDAKHEAIDKPVSPSAGRPCDAAARERRGPRLSSEGSAGVVMSKTPRRAVLVDLGTLRGYTSRVHFWTPIGIGGRGMVFSSRSIAVTVLMPTMLSGAVW
jgi:hypothetical protein